VVHLAAAITSYLPSESVSRWRAPDRQYDSQVAFGQSRVCWLEPHLKPDGTSIVLDASRARTRKSIRLEDEVDYHWGQLFRAACFELFGVGTEIGASSNENVSPRPSARAPRHGRPGVGQQIVRRHSTSTDLTIRPASLQDSVPSRFSHAGPTGPQN